MVPYLTATTQMVSRFVVLCQTPYCKETFAEHYGAGLGYVATGPCKNPRCPCLKFTRPTKV